jgi:hypothetical protein
MKPLLILLALSVTASAVPPIRVTNREFPDRSGSSRMTDPSKQESTETFYDSRRRMTHKVVYKLDERLQPLSGIFYNAKGVVYQKCAYKLDGQDRIIQEVIYDGKDNLLGTKNYHYGTRNGAAIVVDVDTYDSNGNLIQTPRLSKNTKRVR